MKTKNKRRTVWFPDETWARIVSAAALENRTVSGWLRDRATRALPRASGRLTRSDLDAFRVGD